ncbi:MAG: hypothetical protein MUP66_01165 [Candidatus Nanohaloarchaeota archaeon QJJ-5]|nr:hypothetical protein [Candidatus Nanohaloarchaeota archaeon QJJ-5]
MLSLAIDIGFVGAGLIAVVLPFIVGLSTDEREDQFLWVFCLSFLFVLAAGIGNLSGGWPRGPLLAIHGIIWPMVIASFFSFRYEKYHFFWSQFAIPGSMIFPAVFLQRFILEFGAIMASIVLIQVLVYLMVFGNLLVRFIGLFTMLAAVFSIVFFFPLNVFPGLVPHVILVIAHFVLLPGLWLLLVNPATRMELIRSPDLSIIWYGVMSFSIIVLAGLFWELITPLTVGIGLFALLLLWLMRLDIDTGEGLSDFFTTLFLIASISWLVVSLFNITQSGARVVVGFEFTLFRLAIITAVNLVALKLVMDN